MSDSSHPTYENPPVIETVLGVQFEPIPQLTAGMIGKFWATMNQTEWPVSRDADYLPPVREEFGGVGAPNFGALRFHLSKRVQFRVQIQNSENNRLIQVQNDRFHFNWKRVKGAGQYPRYPALRAEFESWWNGFLGFLQQNDIESPKLNQWEVTYLNHIPQETVWNSPEEWGFFRSLNPLPSEQDLLHLESFGGEWHYVIPDNQGRLHVKWTHTTSQETKKQLIVLNLTARGPLRDSNTDSLLRGLDLGRHQIVDSFPKLMTASANSYWGLENGNS